MASKIALGGGGGGGRTGVKQLSQEKVTQREQLERGESSESEDKFASGLQMHVKVW